MIFLNYLKRMNKNTNRKAKRIKKDFIKKYFGLKNIDSDKSIEILYEFKNRIESELKINIEKKSIHYWLHLYRRIAPRGKNSSVTINIFRNILEVAFYKYGREEVNDELLFVKEENTVSIDKIANGDMKRYNGNFNSEYLLPGVYLGNFSCDDYQLMYELEELAIEFWRVTTCIRRIYKGGTLRVSFSEYEVECDEETSKLMKLYDNRYKEGGLSSLNGVTISNETPTGIIPMYNTEAELIDQEFLNRLLGIESSVTINKHFVPNFVWAPFDFMQFYKSNKFLKDEFMKCYGFSLKHFVFICFIISADLIGSCVGNSENVNEMQKRAYRYYVSKKEYIEQLHMLSKQLDFIMDEKIVISEEEIIKIIDYLTVDFNKRNDMSLTTLGPRKMIFSLKNKESILIDYLPLLDIILKSTFPLKINDEKEKQKGYIFEDFVINELKNSGFTLWENKKELKQLDGTSKEIDASFIYKNILFICECKSNKQSITFNMIGDYKTLDYRKRKNIIGINDADDKVKWLTKSSEPKNYKIPDSVDYIVPVLITPFVEYIWNLSDGLWINNDTPRIITCDELIKFVKNNSFEILLKKPYVFKK